MRCKKFFDGDGKATWNLREIMKIKPRKTTETQREFELWIFNGNYSDEVKISAPRESSRGH